MIFQAIYHVADYFIYQLLVLILESWGSHGHGWSNREPGAGRDEAERNVISWCRQMMPKVAPPARFRIFHRHEADDFMQQPSPL